MQIQIKNAKHLGDVKPQNYKLIESQNHNELFSP